VAVSGSSERGALIYVMGPSGAGKDALLRYARDALSEDELVFAHRYITRAPLAGDENFISLSEAEFATRERLGLFRFVWEAHGHHYAIGREIELWRDAGLTVIVSGSRAHFAAGAAGLDDIWPVHVTAAPEIVARRLALRGREPLAAIEARLRRDTGEVPSHKRLVTIENSGPLDDAGRLFVSFLKSFRRGSVPQSSAALQVPLHEIG
jgi:ribose 1,5-bisphosphokinase